MPLAYLADPPLETESDRREQRRWHEPRRQGPARRDERAPWRTLGKRGDEASHCAKLVQARPAVIARGEMRLDPAACVRGERGVEVKRKLEIRVLCLRHHSSPTAFGSRGFPGRQPRVMRYSRTASAPRWIRDFTVPSSVFVM